MYQYMNYVYEKYTTHCSALSRSAVESDPGGGIIPNPPISCPILRWLW